MALHFNRAHKSLFIIACLVMLAGCTLGPDFLRPQTQAQTPDKGFINVAYTNRNALEAMSLWWERIDDPLLDRYVKHLLAENLQIRQAAERIIQAEERRNISAGSYYPGVNASGNGSRSFSNNSLTNARSYQTSYDATLNTSWEIDLFGKIRRSVEAVDAQLLATVYDRNALVHSLIAQLVTLRVDIATNQSLLELSQKTAENRENALQIVERRYEMGVQNTRPQNVLRLRSDVETAHADTHRYERLLADAAYQLDVLLGQTPGTLNPLSTPFPLLAPPVDVPVCVPADLLDRRPDLRSAELLVKAANADIGVAIADLYPSLNLSGSLGFSGESTGNFFNADRLAGSILGAITQRIFEGGALRANIDLQKSEARELSASYSDLVLNAMREVETNLRSEYELGQELDHAKASVQSLKGAENISKDRYLRGIESLSDYLDSQQLLYTAEQNLILTQQAKWNTRIGLYLALGGDWFSAGYHPGCRKTGGTLFKEMKDQDNEQNEN